MTQKHNYPY